LISVSVPKETLPEFAPPMMANSTEKHFDSPDWIFEIKLDGYRAITVFDAAGKTHLWSRNGLPLEQEFPGVTKPVSNIQRRFPRRNCLATAHGFEP
jgi:bifunctional non-homologous end joining protein LigD